MSYDGVDGSQMAFWTYPNVAAVMKSVKHVHDFDEYLVVVQGEYTVVIGRKRMALSVGDECVIPKGTAHSGEATGGTRTIHAFGGKRAERVGKPRPAKKSPR